MRAQQALRLEERDWRRRMILAARKIHNVHMTMSEDLSDTRALKEHLDHLSPRLDRLEELLGSTRDHVEQLESGSRVALEDSLQTERTARAKAEAAEQEARTAMTELQTRYEAELADFDRQRMEQLEDERGQRQAAEQRTQELEAEMQSAFLRQEEEASRREELEAVEGQLQVQLEEMAKLVEELSVEPPEPVEDQTERVNELEERLRSAEQERIELDSRRTQEMTDFADMTHKRMAELERTLRAEREAQARFAQDAAELEGLRKALEEKTRELEEARETLSAAPGPGTAQTSQAVTLMGRDDVESAEAQAEDDDEYEYEYEWEEVWVDEPEASADEA